MWFGRSVVILQVLATAWLLLPAPGGLRLWSFELHREVETCCSLYAILLAPMVTLAVILSDDHWLPREKIHFGLISLLAAANVVLLVVVHFDFKVHHYRLVRLMLSGAVHC